MHFFRALRLSNEKGSSMKGHFVDNDISWTLFFKVGDFSWTLSKGDISWTLFFKMGDISWTILVKLFSARLG